MGGKVSILLGLIWQSLSAGRLLEKIFCNHMWKLNAGLERLLPLGMEIALPHVISHAKALLSTFTSFASFPIKRIHGGTVLLGRWIHFHPLTGTDSVSACEISHTDTINSGDLQSFTMSFMYYLPLALLLFRISARRMCGHTCRIYICVCGEGWDREIDGCKKKKKGASYLTQNSLLFKILNKIDQCCQKTNRAT